MKKLGIVLGVAAVAAISGCKDVNYNYDRTSSKDEVKSVETTPAAGKTVETAPTTAQATEKTPATTVEAVPVEETKVEPTPVEPLPTPKAEPETTTYVVQRGDSLSKISKKFNIKIDAIKKQNNLTSDSIRIGQKLQLPGKVDVGEQAAPVAAKAAPAAAVANKPYEGATQEYVVKAGDTLGAIAYSHGSNIRTVKQLNGLKSDVLRIGQKLKVPAKATAPVVAKKRAPAVTGSTAKPVAAVKAPAAAPKAEATPVAPATETVVEESAPVEAPAAAVEEPVAPAEVAPATYVVQDGDDLTGVTLRWGVTKAAICELNNLAEDAVLTPGQVLKLPADAQQ